MNLSLEVMSLQKREGKNDCKKEVGDGGRISHFKIFESVFVQVENKNLR